MAWALNWAIPRCLGRGMTVMVIVTRKQFLSFGANCSDEARMTNVCSLTSVFFLVYYSPLFCVVGETSQAQFGASMFLD
ncbi:hypothetical protein NL676_020515 [Syzygium grande]|nr:hypothetical protein NL676_020515 [Syzygium grande]